MLRISLLLSACLVGVVQAQEVPRTSSGKPDLQGIWQVNGRVGYDLEAHVARHDMPPGLGIVAEGAIPYLPAALEKRQANRLQRWTADPEIKCYMPGVPRANYLPYPFQIVQGSDTILMSYEFADAVRTVHMQDPGPAPANSWMGWNVGHWEGNSLVVEITDQNNQTWLDRSGNFHSDKLHVTERYTPMGSDMLLYEATLTDPEVFAAAWTIRMPLYRRKEANAQLIEFKCIPFAESVLYDAIGR